MLALAMRGTGNLEGRERDDGVLVVNQARAPSWAFARERDRTGQTEPTHLDLRLIATWLEHGSYRRYIGSRL